MTIAQSVESISTSITYITSHSSSAAAAIAIPLSLVAAILLGALVLLLFRSRRSRQHEKDKERQRQITREALQQSNMAFASATDLERAMWTISAQKGYGNSGMSFPHGPPPIDGEGTFTRPGLSAALAAAALRMNGWTHGVGTTGPTAPLVTDAYTPAPVQRHATGSSARTLSRPSSVHGYYEHVQARRPTNWLDTDWRSSQQTFADDSSLCSGPPQLPAIQIYASSPISQTHIPPLLPPKQLLPGRLDIHTPRPYIPSNGSSSLKSDPSLPPTPGAEVHSSLNVISDYMQASPVPPQTQQPYRSDRVSEPLRVRRVPPPTLPPLEIWPEREENEKPLPLRPEDRVGMDLYGAVSEAVRR